MQRCFRIPELAINIFETFCLRNNDGLSQDIFEENNERLQTLAYLARTCQLFHEPASSVLWRTLYDMEPLIDTIPREALELNEDGSPQRALSPEDLVVFNKYALYVRQIGASIRAHEADIFFNISPGVLESLVLCFPNDPILPNLRHLAWWASEPTCFRLIKWFLGPSLQTLSLVHEPNTHNLDIFTMTPTRCPNLTTINLIDLNNADANITRLFQGGLRVRDVRLRIEYPRPSSIHLGLSELAILPTLEGLELDPCTAAVQTMLPLHSFQALKALTIKKIPAEHEESLRASLAAWGAGAGRLTSLILDDLHTTSEGLQNLFRILGTSASFSTLTTLVVREANPDRAAPNGISLQPLASLALVQSLRIHSDRLLLTDSALRWMPAAWPVLRKLRLSPHAVYHPPSAGGGLTIEGLSHLLVGCTKLETVEMIVDGTVAPRLTSALPLGGRTNRVLRKLRVVSSPVHDGILIATYLSSVAPGVTIDGEVSGGRARWRELGDVGETNVFARRLRDWSQVEYMHRAVVLAREQERQP